MKDSTEPKKVKKTKSEAHPLEKAFRLLALILLSVGAFAGVMSIIGGDLYVRYVIAGVVVFFTAKELV